MFQVFSSYKQLCAEHLYAYVPISILNYALKHTSRLQIIKYMNTL